MAKIVHIDKQLQTHIAYIINPGQEDERNYDTLVDFPSEYCKKDYYYRVSKAGKIGVINSSGNEVVAPQYDDIRPFKHVEDGIADSTYFIAETEGYQGVIDWQGKIVFPFKYEHVHSVDLHKNTAIVSRSPNDSYQKIFGVANCADGKIIIPMEYGVILDMDNGYCLVNKGLWGFADMNGKILVDCKYDHLVDLHEEFTLAYRKAPYRRDFNYDIIARDGTIIGSFTSSEVANWWRIGDTNTIRVRCYSQQQYLVIDKTDDGYRIKPYPFE